MPDVVVLCTEDQLNSDIRTIFSHEPVFEVTFLKTRTMGIQYLNYELPEINLINWSDPVLKSAEIVEEMRKDPWLHYGACIFIYNTSKDAEELRKLTGVNLLASIEKSRLNYYLPRVLEVMRDNPNLLNQWNFSSLVKSHLQGSFRLDRDAFDLIAHANLLVNFLSNANVIGREEKERIFALLIEQLMKVIEFGRGTGTGSILLDYDISSDLTNFSITPEDSSFSWNQVAPPSGTETEGFITTSITGAGKKFHIEAQHKKAQGGLVPNIFDTQKQETYQMGDTVFKQGEESNHLFFIVSGEYEVITNEKRISTLTPLDVFLGEMSFLLRNKRTATVKAVKPGHLVKISKQEYIHTLKDKPHYAFFLARMLAERLAKLHQVKT